MVPKTVYAHDAFFANSAMRNEMMNFVKSKCFRIQSETDEGMQIQNRRW